MQKMQSEQVQILQKREQDNEKYMNGSWDIYTLLLILSKTIHNGILKNIYSTLSPWSYDGIFLEIVDPIFA